jgi:NADH-quinone oxidoreductase subunit N
MSEQDLLALAPFGVLVGGAIVCLTLEAAGTPIGARKRGTRTHLALIAMSAVLAASVFIGLAWEGNAGAVLASGIHTGPLARAAAQTVLALSLIALASAMPALRVFRASKALDEAGEERGEIYALMLLEAAGFVGLCVTDDLTLIAASLVLATVPACGLLVVDRRSPRGAEAAVKLLVVTLVVLALLGLGSALLWGALGRADLGAIVVGAGREGWTALGAVLAAAAILAILPVVPLHAARVDVAQGGPSFVTGFFQGASLTAGAVMVLRALGGDASSPVVAQALLVVATLSLVVPAFAALDQRSIDRLAAHLAIGQAGVALLPAVLVAEGHAERGGLVLICTAGAAAAIVGVHSALGFLEPGSRTSLTWEEWSGLGRKHPVFALGLLWLLGSLAGFPATAGFAARLGTARAAFEDGSAWVGWVAALTPALIAIPVIRLGIFLFAKAPGARCVEPVSSPWRVLVVGVCCALVLVLGVEPEWLWSRFLQGLLAP